MGGLTGPCQTPARMIFSQFIRIPGGKEVAAKRIGHSVCPHDLKSCTPSEHMISPVFVGMLRNPPGCINCLYLCPSWMSWRMPGFVVRVKGYCSSSHFSVDDKETYTHDITQLLVCKTRLEKFFSLT